MEKQVSLFFLDFNGKLPNDTFDDKDAFIRIENLHKENSLVQINDTLFKGSFDYSIGTNLFFEATEKDPKQNDLFVKRTETPFEHVFKSVKVIDLKSVKVPPQKKKVSVGAKMSDFNLDWNYKTLLKKLSDGTLQLHDILKNKQVTENENSVAQSVTEVKEEIDIKENIEENIEEHIEENILVEHSTIETQQIVASEDFEPVDDFASTNLLEDYRKLKRLAFRPVKTIPKLDTLKECSPKFKDSFIYHNLERQILQPCDFFLPEESVKQINEDTFFHCVDIDRCILYGLLDKCTTNPKELTTEEKQKLFTLENFDNLSLAGRYYVLKTHVEALEEHLKKLTKKELESRDNFGRTPKQTLECYKKLTNAVRKRIEEIKYSLKDDNETNANENKT